MRPRTDGTSSNCGSQRTLEAVLSTSALELGIDIADMAIGLNLGVPQSRKSFRQRAGGIGRARQGAFLVMAAPNAFRRYGETFFEYYQASVEPSYLYLGNRFIHYAHAQCFADEMELRGGQRGRPPEGIDWPSGFETLLQYALPAGARPREFDFIAQLGGDSPHLNYALRQVGEAIRMGRIDVVVVYKVDRLTRSLMDFARIVEIFDANNVSFVSVTHALGGVCSA